MTDHENTATTTDTDHLILAADTNGDGKPDLWAKDTTGDGKADMFQFDTTGDGEVDITLANVDEAGVAEDVIEGDAGHPVEH